MSCCPDGGVSFARGSSVAEGGCRSCAISCPSRTIHALHLRLERCSQGLSPYQNRLVDPRLSHLPTHLFHSSILAYTALVANCALARRWPLFSCARTRRGCTPWLRKQHPSGNVGASCACVSAHWGAPSFLARPRCLALRCAARLPCAPLLSMLIGRARAADPRTLCSHPAIPLRSGERCP
jgi:hypothetical protein